MKRDMELIKKILLVIDESDKSTVIAREFNLLSNEYREDVINYHVLLLKEAELINCNIITYANNEKIFKGPISLTWQGHEFLSAAKNNNAWKKLKEKLVTAGSELPFKVIIQLLNSYLLS